MNESLVPSDILTGTLAARWVLLFSEILYPAGTVTVKVNSRKCPS